MAPENGERFVKTRTIMSVLGGVLLAVIAFFARETYNEFKSLAYDFRVVAKQVATSQTTLDNHEKRLDKMELNLYLPTPRPSGPRGR